MSAKQGTGTNGRSSIRPSGGTSSRLGGTQSTQATPRNKSKVPEDPKNRSRTPTARGL